MLALKEGVDLDVISWAAGLIAGTRLPLPHAMGIAAGTSVAIRIYQYFLTDPQVWRAEFPADWLGATAMIVASWVFAYIGSIFRARRMRRASQEGSRA